MNGWLVVPAPGDLYSDQPNLFLTPPCKDSSRVPLLADSISPVTNPMPTDPPPYRLRPHSIAGSGRALANNVCIARHGRAVNVAFLDGHARTVPLPELWKLKWNGVWHDADVVMPPE
jgi:prepilin-type processing-associated H-X9-DG protein